MTIPYIYSEYVYPMLSNALRFCTGLYPKSIGDFIYVYFFIYILFRLASLLICIKKYPFLLSTSGFVRSFLKIGWVFLSFYLCWGINYYRPRLEDTIGLKVGKCSTEDLRAYTHSLVAGLNEYYRNPVAQQSKGTYTITKILKDACGCYSPLALPTLTLQYTNPMIKGSQFSSELSHWGYTGYFNPFTGEAQVDTLMPFFLLPYVACHEAAHQLGYASEREASVLGYLASEKSQDPLFRYSSLFDQFLSANNALGNIDSEAAKANFKDCDSLVKKDLLRYRAYVMDKPSILAPVLKIVYHHYLKANNTPSGINSYDEAIGSMIAYHKKYGY